MQDHNQEGVSYVTDQQLVTASQYATDEEFFVLVKEIMNGKGDPQDAQLYDKALLFTVSRYKNNLTHEQQWVEIAEALIRKGGRIDHGSIVTMNEEMKEGFHDVSFDKEYKNMQAVLEKAGELDQPLSWSKPPRPVRTKPASADRYQQQAQGNQPEDVPESYSAVSLASEVNMDWFATVLKTNLRSVISNESKEEKTKMHQQEIVRAVKSDSKPHIKRIKKQEGTSSWVSAIHQLLRGKQEQKQEQVDPQEQQFRVEHKQQISSLQKAKELLLSLDNNENTISVLQDFHRYLSGNQRRNENSSFDEKLLRRLNTDVSWRTVLKIEESEGNTLRHSAVTNIENFFKERQKEENTQQQKEIKIAQEKGRQDLEDSKDIMKVLNYALYSAKAKYEKEYKDFPWLGYYFNHALTGTTLAGVKKLCSKFYELRSARDDFSRESDIVFKQSQEQGMMNLLKEYFEYQGGLLLQHKDPLDEHSFGTFLLKECYKSNLLRQHFGWDDWVPKISYSILATAEKILQNYAPVFALTVFHALVGDYNGEGMANSPNGRELMRSKMIDKLNIDMRQNISASPVSPN